MIWHVALRKIARALLTILLLLTSIFFVLRLSGDPARFALGQEADQVAIEAYHKEWGLDRPLTEQYAVFLGQVVRLDFGRSYIDKRDALTVVAERLPRTLLLMGVTMLVALGIGIPAGFCAALYRGTWIDRSVMTIVIAGFCLPAFVIAIFLILILSVRANLLPTNGYGTPAHLVMPVIAMSVGEIAVFARYTRSAMLQVLGKPYMQTALAKGLPWRRAVRSHALPNALIPIVTIGGFFVGSMIAGAVITEAVFSWPGVGRLLVTSVASRDLPVLQVIIVMIGVSMVVANLTVDLLYGWLDPRIGALMRERTERRV